MINFFLKWNEYFAAQEFFRRTRNAVAPEYLIGGAFILLGLVLTITKANVFAGGALIVGVIVIIGSPLARRLASKRKWNREPLYRAEHTVAANDKSVFFQMGKIESNLAWNYYQRLVESPEGFLLVYGNDSFNYLPKRAFADQQTIDDFRALAIKKLNKR